MSAPGHKCQGRHILTTGGVAQNLPFRPGRSTGSKSPVPVIAMVAFVAALGADASRETEHASHPYLEACLSHAVPSS